jgi:hypothetical protein
MPPIPPDSPQKKAARTTNNVLMPVIKSLISVKLISNAQKISVEVR